MEREIQDLVVETVSNILENSDDLSEFYAEKFYEFITFIFELKKDKIYMLEQKLQYYISLMVSFIPFITNKDIVYTFADIFSLQFENTEPHVYRNSLRGLVYVIKNYPEYFNNFDSNLYSSFYKRLSFLGKIDDEFSVNVYSFFSFLLVKEDVNFPPIAYETIFELIQYVLKRNSNDQYKSNETCKSEVISMLSYGFANGSFCEHVNTVEIMEIFLNEFYNFNSNEKYESIYAIANFLAYQPPDVVEIFFQSDLFFEVFEEVFNFDDEEPLSNLLDGLHNACIHSINVCNYLMSCESVVELLDSLGGELEVKAHTILDYAHSRIENTCYT